MTAYAADSFLCPLLSGFLIFFAVFAFFILVFFAETIWAIRAFSIVVAMFAITFSAFCLTPLTELSAHPPGLRVGLALSHLLSLAALDHHFLERLLEHARAHELIHVEVGEVELSRGVVDASLLDIAQHSIGLRQHFELLCVLFLFALLLLALPLARRVLFQRGAVLELHAP